MTDTSPGVMVALLTRERELVHETIISRVSEPPDVLFWNNRVFRIVDVAVKDGTYCYVYREATHDAIPS